MSALSLRALLPTPDGEDEARELFGWNPERYLLGDGTVSPKWERDNLRNARLPVPLRYIGRPVHTVRCHVKLVPTFEAVYAEIHKAGLWAPIENYGGGYAFRLIRGGDSLSMHSYGAAVDHDPAANPLGAPVEKCRLGNTEEGRKVVAIFKAFGFFWGGDFRGRKDAQHFQFARNC